MNITYGIGVQGLWLAQLDLLQWRWVDIHSKAKVVSFFTIEFQLFTSGCWQRS
jgi:hypothetical protein